jgi:hypothetical protein
LGAETPTPVHIPDAVDMTWNRFQIHLDPTVLVWGEETHVNVRSVVAGALQRIEGELHGSPTSIVVQAGSVWTIPDVGIGGKTSRGTGDVIVTMDARSPLPAQQLLTVWLPLALAHELHHSKRVIDGPGYGSTLLDAMITEGSAEAFVRATYRDAPAIPWVQPLTGKEQVDVWRQAKNVLSAADDIDMHQKWFVGGGSLPRWPGYRVGYDIARGYLLRHPRATAAQLATLAADRIYAGSGFATAMAAKR